jgi:hypothetical protein
MNDPCARSVTWGGESYTLTLNHPWVRNVLSYRGIHGPNGSSVGAVLNRFESGSYSLDDVEQVLTLGAIGGGMSRAQAAKLIADHVSTAPIADNAGTAAGILVALFMGENKEAA